MRRRHGQSGLKTASIMDKIIITIIMLNILITIFHDKQLFFCLKT